MSTPHDQEVVTCPNCSAEGEANSPCPECGYAEEVGELTESEEVVETPKREPVYAVAVEAQGLAVHEPAWCPYCVVWLGTWPSKEEARAYERSLENHPFEYCTRRIASLNGSEEWRLRHEAGKRGSLALTKPGKPRVPSRTVSA